MYQSAIGVPEQLHTQHRRPIVPVAAPRWSLLDEAPNVSGSFPRTSNAYVGEPGGGAASDMGLGASSPSPRLPKADLTH